MIIIIIIIVNCWWTRRRRLWRHQGHRRGVLQGGRRDPRQRAHKDKPCATGDVGCKKATRRESARPDGDRGKDTHGGGGGDGRPLLTAMRVAPLAVRRRRASHRFDLSLRVAIVTLALHPLPQLTLCNPCNLWLRRACRLMPLPSAEPPLPWRPLAACHVWPVSRRLPLQPLPLP